MGSGTFPSLESLTLLLRIVQFIVGFPVHKHCRVQFIIRFLHSKPSGSPFFSFFPLPHHYRVRFPETDHV